MNEDRSKAKNLQEGLRHVSADIDSFLTTYRSAQANGAREPDDNSEAALLSAREAVESAQGWLEDATDAFEEIPRARGENTTDQAEMAKEVAKIAGNLHDMLEENSEAPESGADGEKLGSAHDHLICSLSRLNDARNILSGKNHAKENPNPYENG